MRPFNSRNVFDLSHEVKLTCEMGKLVPILCQEVVPGDKFRVSSDMVVRMAPMLAPIMHNVNVYTHFFFVPNRLIFDDWESFITGGEEGNDATVAPTISLPDDTGFATSSLGDYLGVPTGVTGTSVSALPFRAYAKIYNDYYRDENLQEEVALSTAAGEDTTTNTELLTRAWQHDFFTDALPFQQRGPAVNLPLGTVAPVRYYNNAVTGEASGYTGRLVGLGGGTTGNTTNVYALPTDAEFNVATTQGNLASGTHFVGADLTDATAATINDIRYAFQVQRFLEKNARAGVRYIESILANFGVKSSDARLQRSEYLGGGKSPIMISDVIQQSADDNEPTPLGTMAGHGFSSQRSHQFKKFFEEHGFVIGIMSIMPRSTYQQGLSKMWTRSNRYDYYWPVFSHLGEQAIKNKEIYLQSDSVVDAGQVVNDKVFGYQPRYQEYRRKYSTVHGDFRSSLNFWHLGRIFSNLPALNAEFIKCQPSNRIFAVESGVDHMWVDIFHKIKAIRPIPKHGTPGFIDHD